MLCVRVSIHLGIWIQSEGGAILTDAQSKIVLCSHPASAKLVVVDGAGGRIRTCEPLRTGTSSQRL